MKQLWSTLRHKTELTSTSAYEEITQSQGVYDIQAPMVQHSLEKWNRSSNWCSCPFIPVADRKQESAVFGWPLLSTDVTKSSVFFCCVWSCLVYMVLSWDICGLWGPGDCILSCLHQELRVSENNQLPVKWTTVWT